MGVHFDTSEVEHLAADLVKVPRKAMGAVNRAGDEASGDLRDTWRNNARRSAGRHGKHYPNAITAERSGVLEWEIGPESARPQGGMSFEFGSRNQPPHLDGSRAADVHAPQWTNKVADVIDEVDLL